MMNQMNNFNNFNMQNNKPSNNNSNKITLDFDFKVLKAIDGDNFFSQKGLDNVCLTCYMNAILQCLLHIPELNSFFINIYPQQKQRLNQINQDSETRGKLSEEYYKIVQGVMHGQGSSYSPKAFNDYLSYINPQFRKYESNDSKDLLLFLFQTMHEELNYYGNQELKNIRKCNQYNKDDTFNFFVEVNKKLNKSIISHLFYGISKSYTSCKDCKAIIYNFQFFPFLSFPLANYDKRSFNIYRGFKDFSQLELLSGIAIIVNA